MNPWTLRRSTFFCNTEKLSISQILKLFFYHRPISEDLVIPNIYANGLFTSMTDLFWIFNKTRNFFTYSFVLSLIVINRVLLWSFRYNLLQSVSFIYEQWSVHGFAKRSQTINNWIIPFGRYFVTSITHSYCFVWFNIDNLVSDFIAISCFRNMSSLSII